MLAHDVAELRNAPRAEQNMGMPVIQERRWSAEDVQALPEDPRNRYEAVDGELLVTPAPRIPHQAVVAAVYRALFEVVRAHRVGLTLFAPVDVILDARTLVQPDVLVLPPTGQDVMRGEVPAPTPLLVVEVLSPTTARNDRLLKRQRYQRAGVECWLVDIDSQLVERWTPDAERPEICVEHVLWEPMGLGRRLTVELLPIWAETAG
ncbi:MAG TPA: Uma2 family endonuclease [Gemmatimonas aurantiaca]|uniref:Uma2 family endonuclease n=2 Tax=Gemmatimonas aurantiaca TaxID=173480 RepID=A0A3D4VAV3_9BACT|nr:Uma2 family endonuclease [Gemmatimonas aurantiaca]